MTIKEFFDQLKAQGCDGDMEVIVSEGARYGPPVFMKTSGKNEIIITMGE